MFEYLENRVLLTLTPDVNNVLTIDGGNNNDSYEITQPDPNGILVWKDLNSGATDQTAAPFTGTLVMNMNGGNDFLRLREAAFLPRQRRGNERADRKPPTPED